MTGIHCFLTGAPVGWADLAVLLYVLECFHQSQCFFRVATYWQIIDTRVSQNTALVNNESSSERNGSIGS